MDRLDPPSENEGAETPLEAAEALLTYGIAIAERGPEQVRARDYKTAHRLLLSDPTARRTAKRVLVRCTSPDLLWGHLRSVATGPGSWELRRNAVHDLMDPILDALHEADEATPADELVAGAAERLDADSVTDAWTRALARRSSDPQGAITMARTLLESTLKTILEDRGVEYRDNDDLPALYKVASKELNLAPGDYSEDAFKQILGGAHSVVVGLGSLRNKAGDAHGAGRRSYRAAGRHAALAVNLAGSTALFLIETHEAQSEK